MSHIIYTNVFREFATNSEKTACITIQEAENFRNVFRLKWIRKRERYVILDYLGAAAQMHKMEAGFSMLAFRFSASRVLCK